MQIRQKAPLIVVSIAILTAGLSTYSSYVSNKRMIDAAKSQELRTTATVIQDSILSQSNKAAARASLVVNLPSLQEAFRRQSRADITTRLVPAFLAQREQYGVREGQFHLAPAFSFLRLFDLQNGHGEDLSAFRQMVVAANTTQTPQKGVEIGRRGLSIRGVYPMKDAQGPIGSFEVGMSFSTVLQEVKKTTGFEAGVFVDDAQMASIATSMPRPDPERIIGGFQAVEATNWQAIRAVSTAEVVTNITDVSTHLPIVDGNEQGTVVVPVKDYKGQPIGSVVATRNFEDYQTQSQWALVSMLSLAFMQALLVAGVMLVVINGLLVGPVGSISDKLAAIFKRQPAPKLDEIVRADDEIGAMARNVDALEGFVAEKRRPSHSAGRE